MKLGDVLKKERGRSPSPSIEETVSRLNAILPAKFALSRDDYRRLEAGESEAETWAPVLAQIAINLETPTSRLLTESGRARDARMGNAGKLICAARERRKLEQAKLLAAVNRSLEPLVGPSGGLTRLLSKEEYRSIEEGRSPLEPWGPRLLAFAEVIEQPVFNLFYPCGLAFQELDDYP